MFIGQIVAAIVAWRKGWGLLVLGPVVLGLLTPSVLAAVPGHGVPPAGYDLTGHFVAFVGLILMCCADGPWAVSTSKA